MESNCNCGKRPHTIECAASREPGSATAQYELNHPEQFAFLELLIGCGHSRVKKMPSLDGNPNWRGLVTLDKYTTCEPDWLCDLEFAPWCYVTASQWNDGAISAHTQIAESCFNEVHAYEVLEHLGRQGDAFAYFATFAEIWRILKPGGHLLATVPSRFSPWLWGDPSHTRAVLPESLVFLDQSEYTRQLDGPVKTAMSDFRSIYKADFRVRRSFDNRETFQFILEAVKPSRCSR